MGLPQMDHEGNLTLTPLPDPYAVNKAMETNRFQKLVVMKGRGAAKATSPTEDLSSSFAPLPLVRQKSQAPFSQSAEFQSLMDLPLDLPEVYPTQELPDYSGAVSQEEGDMVEEEDIVADVKPKKDKKRKKARQEAHGEETSSSAAAEAPKKKKAKRAVVESDQEEEQEEAAPVAAAAPKKKAASSKKTAEAKEHPEGFAGLMGWKAVGSVADVRAGLDNGTYKDQVWAQYTRFKSQYIPATRYKQLRDEATHTGRPVEELVEREKEKMRAQGRKKVLCKVSKGPEEGELSLSSIPPKGDRGSANFPNKIQSWILDTETDGEIMFYMKSFD